VSQRRVHRQCAARDRAVGEGHLAVPGKHRHRPEAERAVGHAGRRCRIGDERDAVRARRVNSDAHHVVVHVEAVIDQLAGHCVVGERRAGGARLAVMELAHRVEQVRGDARSGCERQPGLGERRLGMPDGRQHAGRGE
jgi:hypothetical protein